MNEIKDDRRNWTEDYSHENGDYMNICMTCNELFRGHKRRVQCKLCVTSWFRYLEDTNNMNYEGLCKCYSCEDVRNGYDKWREKNV